VAVLFFSLVFFWQSPGKRAAERGKSLYLFEGFELDPAERRLMGPAGPIALTPKVFDTLLLLVQRANHIVTKEEIIQAIWPRGFVDESNLTKHIWLIRRALGENERSVRFIETVPKRGYRFVARVTESTVSHDAETTPRTSTPRRGATLTLVVLGVLALSAAWYLWPQISSHPSHAGRTVAFVGFSNLSHNPKDGWIAPALTEMLSAEVNVTSDLHVVPDELVRDVSSELSPPAVSGYSLPTLQRLSRRLDADYVVSGSYLVGSTPGDPSLRVELSAQDARTGAVLATPTFESSVARLTSLVSEAGARLRQKLSTSSPDPKALDLMSQSQPPTVEVAQRVGLALEALQHYDAARARDELLQAIAEAPGYPLAYVHLAQAWTALGFHEKALAAAEQAQRLAASLSPEQQLQTQAMVAVARSDWPHAVEIYQSLARLKPLNPEYRLQCIAAQINASATDQAQVSITELRKLPGVANDPRVELAASSVARARDDAQGEADHAAAALKQATAHEAPGLIAQAQLQLAHAQERLGQLPQAHASLEAAVGQFRAIHNPRGEAQAQLALGVLSATEHHAQVAREEYQSAMALYQSIDDQAGVASVYREVCSMLWDAGDRDGAQTAAREGLQIAREIGDLTLQSWTLRALATIASDEAASDEVMNEYREVLELTHKNGDRGGHVWSLAALADLERLRGSLDQARADCMQAKTEAAALTDRQFAIYSGFTCALVDIDRGDARSARAGLSEVLQLATATRYPIYPDSVRMSLAELDMDERQWMAAREQLLAASHGFAADDIETGEANAMAMLALCEQALGNRAGRDQAAGRARKLRETITSRQEVYLVDIALAQLESTRPGKQVHKLLELASDAAQRHFVAWALEARLAAWEMLHGQGNTAAAETLRARLDLEARRTGFGRIVNRLHAAPAAAATQPAAPIQN
jgi:DNA-binding winged helix-turn-helix (wHTH) protein/tetratricopeptide (TPR) repeat protein